MYHKKLLNSTSLCVCEAYSSTEIGKKMKIHLWKVKLFWIFHYVTKRSVRSMGQRRETWVTWARPGHAGGGGKALPVTARARQQLTYAGHRKAELRRHHSHRDLCCVDVSSKMLPSFTLFTQTVPRLYGWTGVLQYTAAVPYRWLGCNPWVVRHIVLEQRAPCKYASATFQENLNYCTPDTGNVRLK